MRIISFITLFIFFGLGQAMAATKLLATINRTSDAVKSKLYLVTDKNEDISHVEFKIYEEDGSLDRSINVSPKELKEGKEVLSKLGVGVITLQSDNMAIHNGGNVNIKYLTKYKLIGKSNYANFEVLLDRLGDTWELSKDGRSFNVLMAHTHSKGITKFEIVK